MNLKEKLKELRNKLTSYKPQNKSLQITDNEKKQIFDIKISENNGIFKVEISDYINIVDYLERMKKIDTFDIDSKLTNSVLWNNRKQRVNKGVYFVFHHNNKLYNILINENIIKIDERTKIGEETEEKIIEFNINYLDYNYFRCMHDKNFSSYLTRYYSKNNPVLINLELPQEEFYEDLSSILSNLETLENIRCIINIDIIKQQILENLNKKRIQNKKKI